MEGSSPKKWEAYEATKEYKAWRALEKQALDSVNSALASTSEYQKAEIARNKAYSTKEYQAMIKAQNAVRATQHYKDIKEIAKAMNAGEGYDSSFDTGVCILYGGCRSNIRESKEFKAWQIANERFMATDEFRAWQVAIKASQTTKEYKARELVKKEIKEGRENIANTGAIYIRKFEHSKTLYCYTLVAGCLEDVEEFSVIPKNWEYDLWYGDDDIYSPTSYFDPRKYDWEY